MPLPAWLVSPILTLIRPHLEDVKRDVLTRAGQVSREEQVDLAADVKRALALAHERMAALEAQPKVVRLVHTIELTDAQTALLREWVGGAPGEAPGVSPPAPSDEDVVRAEANREALRIGVDQILGAAADQGVSMTAAQAQAYAAAALAGQPLPMFPAP